MCYPQTMITPSHLIYNWAAAKALDQKLGEDKSRLHGFLLGGILPDIPAYTFFVFYTFIAGASQNEMWDVLYFDSPFSVFITLSHSFLLWPAVLLIGYVFRKEIIMWLGAGAMMHSVIDFLVHNDDAYMHFWPLSEWKFMSPISYWDPSHYGNIVGTVDTVLILLLLWWFSRNLTNWKQRSLVYGVATFYFLMTILPWLIFTD